MRNIAIERNWPNWSPSRQGKWVRFGTLTDHDPAPVRPAKCRKLKIKFNPTYGKRKAALRFAAAWGRVESPIIIPAADAMQKISSPQEVAELELALEKTRRVPAFRALLVFFWGLILAKCLLAEWAVTYYHAPINTKFYVWTLSLAGSGALTLVYAAALFKELPTMPLSGRIVSATWASCTIGFGVLLLVAKVYHAFDLYLLPALAAVLLGVGCFIQSVIDRRILFKILAAGWWLSALWLFTLTDVTALAWMAVSLLVLVVLPSGWLFFTRNRRKV